MNRNTESQITTRRWGYHTVALWIGDEFHGVWPTVEDAQRHGENILADEKRDDIRESVKGGG